MDLYERIRRASNSFYNMGLEQAKIRDLTGAAGYLKKCLNLNKYHIDARNLLGLIYYEMGEISEALVQWVISMNIQESGNRADYYLDQIQRRQERLEVVSQNVKKYNQALMQARSGSDDLAVLQLTRVVESNPNFIKAHLLLAVLYMSHEDYTKAGKSLYKVLKIDKNNPKANWYMSIVKAKTGKAEIERHKLKNAFSHRQMLDDDVIIPPSYRENTGWQSILNIGAGLLLGAALIFFVVMPATTKQLNTQHNQELNQKNEQLNQKNEEIDQINSTIQQYKDDKDSAESQLNTLLNSNDSVLNQYSILVKMLQAYREDNLTEAVTLYAGFDPSLFTDESVIAIANGIKSDIETNGYQTLEDLAYTMWSAGRMSEALSYYQTCLSIRPDNPKVLYNMGMINRSQNQIDTAVQLFTQVVTQYGSSEYAPRASSQLSELAPQSMAAGAAGQAAPGETGDSEEGGQGGSSQGGSGQGGSQGGSGQGGSGQGSNQGGAGQGSSQGGGSQGGSNPSDNQGTGQEDGGNQGGNQPEGGREDGGGEGTGESGQGGEVQIPPSPVPSVEGPAG